MFLLWIVLLPFYAGIVVSLPVVSFRLDDVQAWWCSDISNSIIEIFFEENVPLNVGVIGNYLDQSSIGNYLASVTSNPLLEIASRSQNNAAYGGHDLSWQSQDLSAANAMISTVTSKIPAVFIPPSNSYDSTTATALSQNQMSVLSSQCTVQFCPEGSNVIAPNLKWNDITMLPAGAVLGNLAYWQDYTQPGNLTAAIEWIENQIQRQGFSVVMLRPVEFSIDSGSCLVLNPTKISVLRDLIAYGRGRYEYKTFANAKLALTGEPEIATTFPPTVTPVSPAPTPPKPNRKPVVSFRLDDVQAWWCRDITETVIDIFLEEHVPINLGIIGVYLDQSPILTYLRSIVSNPLIEVASHSFQHLSYGGHNLSWQETDMHDASVMIKAATAKVPHAFIPPNNDYDEMTVTAMLENDITFMSAECTTRFCEEGNDVVAPHLEWRGITMLPAGAVLGNTRYWNDYSLPANLTAAIHWVESQVGT
jgi:peptidoglycan/xylan/chitin deacetylase (PgdA/CDA1 family)